MRRVRLVVAALVVLVAAVVVGAAAVISSIDVNAYRGDIARAVGEVTGRELTIAGPMTLDLSLQPAVVVEDVRLANPPGMSRPDMAVLRRLEARVELLPLVRGNIRVRYVVVEGLDLLLERDGAGAPNWVLDAPGAEGTSGGVLPVVHEVRLRDVAVGYLDEAGGQRRALALDSLDISSETASSPLRFSAKGRIQDEPFSADGQLPSLLAIAEGGAYALRMNVALAGLVVDVDGALAQPREGKGVALAVTATAEDVAVPARALLGLAGVPVDDRLSRGLGPLSASARIEGSLADPAATELDVSAGRADTVRVALQGGVEHVVRGEGLDLRFSVEGRDLSAFSGLAGGELPADKPFSLAGRLTDGGGAYGVDGLSITAGDSALSGWATAALGGARPKVEAQLLADVLDMNDLPLPASGPPAEPAPGRVLSRQPLPLDVLSLVDGDIDFQAKKVVAGRLALTDVAARLVLADGRLTVKPMKARLAGGLAEGDAVVDGSAASTARVSVDMTVKGADAGRLVRDLAGEDVLSGSPADVTVRLSGAGDSPQALVASLDGELRASLGPGRLSNGAMDALGGDVAMQAVNALNPFSAQEAHTELQCGALRFAFGNGRAVADKGIALETGRMTVVGSGAVDLATEQIDFTFRPEAREGLGLNVGGVASIVRVTGTLAQPGVGLDALEAGKKALSVGAAIATGGVSLLAEGLLNRVTADPQPCRTALGLQSAGAPSRPAAQTPAGDGGIKGLLDGFGRSLNDTLRGR